MSSILSFPHAEYAEDQRFAKSILTIHVLERGMQTGTIAGVGVGALMTTYQRYQFNRRQSSPSTVTMTDPTVKSTLLRAQRPQYPRALVPSAGIGALTGLVSMTVMLPYYMSGREEIEWQDRSWRLLGNKGQVEVDSFARVGGVLGIASSAVTGFGHGTGNGSGRVVSKVLLDVLGRASIGGLAGVVGYMGWRYGVQRGEGVL